MAEVAATFEMPKDGFMCFHCGERFTTYGAARDHFGEAPGATAGCLIPVVPLGEGRGCLMALRKAEAAIVTSRAEGYAAGQRDMKSSAIHCAALYLSGDSGTAFCILSDIRVLPITEEPKGGGAKEPTS